MENESSKTTSTWTRVTRSPSVIGAVVDEELVLIDVERGEYYGLQCTGRMIWEALETPRSLEELCTLLQGSFSGDGEVIRNETALFLHKLADHGAVDFT